MTPQQNRATTEQFIEEVWRQGQIDRIDELFTENYVDHSFGPAPAGREDLKRFVTMFRQAFPDLEYQLHQALAEGDRVASHDTVHATHKGDFMGIPATGKRVSVPAMHILRFENGRIAEHWGITDVATLMQQLGVGPGR